MDNEMRLNAEKVRQERKRNVMVLILMYLKEEGYVDSCDSLQQESNCSLQKFTLADNIDLLFVFTEFEKHQEYLLGKKLRVVRKIDEKDEVDVSNHSSAPASFRSQSASKKVPSISKNNNHVTAQHRLSSNSDLKGKVSKVESKNVGFQSGANLPPLCSPSSSLPSSIPPVIVNPEQMSITGNAVGKKIDEKGKAVREDASSGSDYFDTRLIRPLKQYTENPELMELARQIQSEIYLESPNVRWDDIAGLTDAKRLLKEAVVMPLKYPELFTGLLTPWKGILLYGPPGTGKTMLAKAVATECRTTFFNIKASSIVSKWRGDSEKLVRVLFDLAKHHAPSTIFLDELDSIIGQRGGDGGMEHEGSRRMKSEILTQMDGLNADSRTSVFVLSASNLPWDLDSALVRRLEKRILVGLPDESTRLHLFHKNLPMEVTAGDLEYRTYSKKTEGYSGADIHAVCREALMWPRRRLFEQIEHLEAEGGHTTENIRREVHLDPVTRDDVERALQSTRPTAQTFLDRYKTWETERGAV